MKDKELKLKGISKYSGFSISPQKVVTLNMIMSYGDIVTSVSLLQGLHSDISVFAKLGLKKPAALGVFTINSVNFDKDGNAKVSLKSMLQSVDYDNIMDLILCEDVIQLMFKAIIELPGEAVEEVDEEEEEELPFN